MAASDNGFGGEQTTSRLAQARERPVGCCGKAWPGGRCGAAVAVRGSTQLHRGCALGGRHVAACRAQGTVRVTQPRTAAASHAGQTADGRRQTADSRYDDASAYGLQIHRRPRLPVPTHAPSPLTAPWREIHHAPRAARTQPLARLRLQCCSARTLHTDSRRGLSARHTPLLWARGRQTLERAVTVCAVGLCPLEASSSGQVNSGRRPSPRLPAATGAGAVSSPLLARPASWPLCNCPVLILESHSFTCR
ncbi:uncharacterized protein CC84DRAFT_1207187 [Paraphaeosphaeria sporulosa]|uniref:Uncharacterized protein n=1 Tax=Paraphaeosphaeria sporulosa TaxID=1460663 RepID=A0A177C8S1_9PLEO|nr:uncharacterized protein CC84DRAFT_1207187 [Paraphaeosphaeria sporulosa]OAG03955.1 hypothetical protein CC84DRAFT_1207187 [Paraphaeosphaeria sporulosa]